MAVEAFGLVKLAEPLISALGIQTPEYVMRLVLTSNCDDYVMPNLDAHGYEISRPVLMIMAVA